MLKLLLLLTFSVSASLFVNFDTGNLGGAKTLPVPTPEQTPSVTPTPTPAFVLTPPTSWTFQIPPNWIRNREPVEINKPADVTVLSLSKAEISSSCAGEKVCPIIEVLTTAVDPENDTIIYEYTVSGGTIEGKGTSVKWNLTGLKPGRYTITAGVDDGCGVCGKTQTRDVMVYQEDQIKEVSFDKDEIYTGCPFGHLQHPSCPQAGEKVSVTTKIDPRTNPEYKFYYVVTGGKIIGEGPDVTWDFTGIRPGKYELTVAMGKDNVILTNTVTKKIDFKECSICDPPPVECPTITINGPEGYIKPGKLIVLRANLAGGKQTFVTYKWNVSVGTITSGQGSSQIIVKTPSKNYGDSITATVETGNLDHECPTIVDKTIFFTRKE